MPKIKFNPLSGQFDYDFDGKLYGVIPEFKSTDVVSGKNTRITKKAVDNAAQRYNEINISSITRLLLMNMNESSFMDSSTYSRTVTVNGATLDTSVKVFGAGSAKFGGTTNRLSVAASTDFDFGTGDFTIQFRLNANSAITNTEWRGLLNRYESDNERWALLLWNNAGIYTLWFYSIDGGVFNIDMQRTWAPTLNTQYHIEITRNGNNWRIFIDGVQLGATYVNASSLSNPNAALEIGQAQYQSAYTYNSFDGWIDELIIDNIALHTSGFTPPITESSASTTEINVWKSENEPGYSGKNTYSDVAAKTVIEGADTHFNINAVEVAQINSSGQFDAESHKIVNVTDPTANQDASTKNYTDTKVALDRIYYSFLY